MLKILGRTTLIIFTLWSLSARAADDLENQKMYWKPTDDTSDFQVGSLANHKFKIGKFTDARKTKPKNQFGENVEGQDKRIASADTSDFGPFVADGITQTLQKAGMDIVDKGAQLTLSGTIRDYSVREENTYVGNCAIKYTLSKGDKVVWTGVYTGSAKRFGRSYKMDNYMETLSDSLMDTLKKLLNDSEFRAAAK